MGKEEVGEGGKTLDMEEEMRERDGSDSMRENGSISVEKDLFRSSFGTR